LQLQGQQYSDVANALREGDLDKAPISEAERLLLRFVETLTKHAYKITDRQVEELRNTGWSNSQIAEAVYIGALFNFFVRVADAFDIHPPLDFDPNGIPPVINKD
jgi:alkylhydroperoxidase family enzyme